MGQRIFDEETGEIFYEQVVRLKEGQYAQVVDISKYKGIKHVKLRTASKQKRLLARLDHDEKALLFTLLLYMEWESNLVVGDGELGEKNKPLKWAQIDKVAGFSKPHRINLAKSLVGKRVLGYLVTAENIRVGIVVNPEYALFGKKPTQALLNTFNATEDVMQDDEEADNI